MRIALILLCTGSALAAAWLAAMENVLRHAGYAQRSAGDFLLTLPGLLTLLALARPHRWLKGTALLGGLAMAVYGLAALARSGRGAGHFEGYAALMGLAMFGQGVLTAVVLGRSGES